MSEDKRCYACKEVKELSLFYKDASRTDGHGRRCKKCDNAYTLFRYYRRRVTERYKAKQLRSSTKYIKQYPERQRARALAARYGLRKDNCENCGATGKLHMHHPDYSKPLDVTTLCVTCHEAIHHGVAV